MFDWVLNTPLTVYQRKYFETAVVSHIGHFHFFYHTEILDQVQKQPPVFYKKGASKNFAKFTGKCMCWSLLFHKKRDSDSGIFKNIYYGEHLRAAAPAG